MTFYPSVAGERMVFQFLSFWVEECCDYLLVYNGPDASFPLLGEFRGSNLPPILTSSHSTGALTFYFHSDHSVLGDWEAIISTVPEVNADISTPSQSLLPDSIFEIPVNTTELTANDSIVSYQFTFDYDTAMLEYLGKSLVGTIAEGGTADVNSSTAGHLQIGYISSSFLTGAGDILKLQFRAKTVGTTTPTISGFLYNTFSVSSVSNGTVTITGDVTPPSVALTYSKNSVRWGENLLITATFSEVMADIPVPQISLSGAVTLAANDLTKVSDSIYTFTFSTISGLGTVSVTIPTGNDLAGNQVISTPTSGTTFEILPLHYGDIDDNDTVQAFDAALALRYSVGIDPMFTAPLPWNAWRRLTADVDFNDTITANDASLILQYSIGKISNFLKKSVKIGSTEMNIVVNNGNLEFSSNGDLFGLNVFVNKDFNVLGQPVVLNSDMIQALNIKSDKYAIGLATAYAPKAGEVFMKIPFTASDLELTFDLIVNKEYKTVKVSLVGIENLQISNISVSPNPAKDVLKINGLTKQTSVSIVDVTGKVILTKVLSHSENTFNIENLTNGVYFVKIGNFSQKIVKE